uniref:Kinesin motor domain-containing protein n=1 Tax=Sinocyclocheilus anshuiensis TaxID=1608454 RepID=A0A671L4I5_9TELE
MASESLKVVVRCRPLNDREKAMNCKMVISIDSSHCQCFIEKPGGTEQFTFDGTYMNEPFHLADLQRDRISSGGGNIDLCGVTEGYNGTIFTYGQTGSGDLLGKETKQKMKLNEHPECGVYVRDLSMHTVHSVGECERIMDQGWRNRSVGYTHEWDTLMNKDASRSHSIFTIHLEICNTGWCLNHTY